MPLTCRFSPDHGPGNRLAAEPWPEDTPGITSRYDTAGHSLNSRLCRVPADAATRHSRIAFGPFMVTATAAVILASPFVSS